MALNALLGDQDTEEVVCGAIEAVWESTSAALHDRWLRSLEPEFAAAQAMMHLHKTLHLAFYDADASTTAYGSDTADYHVEREPEPSERDKWASGSVPMKVQPKGSMDSIYAYKRGVSTASEDTTRGSHRTRSSSHRSSTARSKYSRGGTANRNNRDRFDAPPDEVVIVELGSEVSDQDEGFDVSNSLGTLFVDTGKSDVQVMDPKEVRRQKQQQLQRQREREREELDKAIKDLKGQPVAFDYSGCLVPLSKPKADRLPQHTFNVGISISTDETGSVKGPPSSSST